MTKQAARKSPSTPRIAISKGASTRPMRPAFETHVAFELKEMGVCVERTMETMRDHPRLPGASLYEAWSVQYKAAHDSLDDFWHNHAGKRFPLEGRSLKEALQKIEADAAQWLYNTTAAPRIGLAQSLYRPSPLGHIGARSLVKETGADTDKFELRLKLDEEEELVVKAHVSVYLVIVGRA